MPIDPDFAREERIKRLRALVKSGTDQLLVLHEAIPEYIRLGNSVPHAELPNIGRHGKRDESRTAAVKRNTDISLGYMIAERYHAVYSKV